MIKISTFLLSIFIISLLSGCATILNGRKIPIEARKEVAIVGDYREFGEAEKLMLVKPNYWYMAGNLAFVIAPLVFIPTIDTSLKSSTTPILAATAVSLIGLTALIIDGITGNYYQTKNPETFRLWYESYKKETQEKIDSLILKHKN